jgi:hypothetical protein
MYGGRWRRTIDGGGSWTTTQRTRRQEELVQQLHNKGRIVSWWVGELRYIATRPKNINLKPKGIVWGIGRLFDWQSASHTCSLLISVSQFIMDATPLEEQLTVVAI